MRIYTRQGDDGYTRGLSRDRMPKDNPIFEAIGTIDELNSYLGIVRSMLNIDKDNISVLIKNIQSRLLDLNTEILARFFDRIDKFSKYFITDNDVKYLENYIDKFSENIPKLNEFILPAGSMVATHLHYARTICRRAERRVVTLINKINFKDSKVIPYLNRLSDLLYTLARYVNYIEDIKEEYWRR